MARFCITGIIKEIEESTFGTNNIAVKKVAIQEAPKSANGTITEYSVEFAGAYAREIPKEIEMKGCEVMILGSLSSIISRNGTPMTFLKGERLLVINYPLFEEEDVNTGDTVAYTMPQVTDEDDLPF